jgi:hypothetical protein
MPTASCSFRALVAIVLAAEACSRHRPLRFDNLPGSASGGGTETGGPPDPGAAGPSPYVTPAPVTGHPRLWVRASDVARLQAWATPANPMFARGLKPAVDHAIDAYDNKLFPGGQANPSWPDPGDTSWVALATEAYAEIFAFMSLVDPDPAARASHRARARYLLMYV